jgi:hypothetical protein
MTSCGMSRPGVIEHGPRTRHLEASSHRRHHGAGRHAVPTPERTMTPVRHKIRALVGEAAIREHSEDHAGLPFVTPFGHSGAAPDAHSQPTIEDLVSSLRYSSLAQPLLVKRQVSGILDGLGFDDRGDSTLESHHLYLFDLPLGIVDLSGLSVGCG